MLLSKKAIIDINKEFEDGKVINPGSLDYSINIARRTKNWLKALSHIARAILIDHVFEEGNKRTASAVIVTFFEMNSISYNKDKVQQLIVQILKKNITSLREIERLLKNATE